MKCLKIFSIVLAFFCALSANAASLTFILASDVHYETEKTADSKIASSVVLSYFVKRANEEKPDFVAFLGDNTDKSKPEYLKGFLSEIKKLKRPYYLAVGNHDSHKYSGMSRQDYSEAISKSNKYQKKYNANYYFYPNQDIIVILVDSVSLAMPGPHGYFTDETLVWLDDVLSKNKNKKAIILQHVPYLEPVPQDKRKLLDAKSYGDIIRRYNNVLMIASGHYHHYAINQDLSGMYHISAPALSESPYEYLDVEITYDKKPLGAENFKVICKKKVAL